MSVMGIGNLISLLIAINTLDKNFDNAWVGYNLDRLLELKELG